MTILYQQNIIEEEYPYNIFMTRIQEYPPHWHDEYEIIYNLDESFDVGIGDEIITLETGDIYIVEPRVLHSFQVQSTPRNRLIVQFKPRYFSREMNDYEPYRLVNPHIKCRSHIDCHEDMIYNTMRLNLEVIRTEYSKKDTGYEYMMMSKLYEFFSCMHRFFEKVDCTKQELSQRDKRINKLQLVFDYVDMNYHKEITLTKIAEHVGYSHYYFARFFKENTGMTFNEYLSNYRVIKVSEDLLRDDESITEISLNAGFSSIKTFNRVFKKIKGCSPTEYKKAISE